MDTTMDVVIYAGYNRMLNLTAWVTDKPLPPIPDLDDVIYDLAVMAGARYVGTHNHFTLPVTKLSKLTRAIAAYNSNPEASHYLITEFYEEYNHFIS